MPTVSADDDFKLLYTYILVSGAKARMADVGRNMGLKANASAWRFNALMKRLEKQFGPIKNTTASTYTPSAKSDEAKRKRSHKEAVEKVKAERRLKFDPEVEEDKNTVQDEADIGGAGGDGGEDD